MSADGRLFVPDLASLTGLKPRTVQTYYNAATLARRHGPGHETDWPPQPLIPPPDGKDYPPGRMPAGAYGGQSGARSPYWDPNGPIREYLAAQGIGADAIRDYLAARRDRASAP